MEVILLEKIGKLGSLGDIVKVKDGYARNFLIPCKKALRTTKANIEAFEKQKAELSQKSEAEKKAAEATASKLAGRTFVAIRQAGDAGHLYGSVSTRDISALLAADGENVEYAKITIDTPIKELGIYKVRVALHPEVVETIKINVARTEEEAKVAEEKADAAALKAEEEKKAKKDRKEIGAAEIPEEAAVSTEKADVAETISETAPEEPSEAKPAKKRASKKKAEGAE